MPEINFPYDLSTFSGRYLHFLRITSPLHLLDTDRDLANARQLISDYRTTKQPHVFDMKRLQDAKYTVAATIHPDTNEKILLPFRMSSFIPTNLLVTAGMLIPNATVKSMMFWQIANQSVNVGFNYCNANKSTEMSTQETVLAYLSAVGASVGISVGLKIWVTSTSLFSASTKMFVGRFVPFVAVASAGTINLALMRANELSDGIDIKNDDGVIVGKSPAAGVHAITQVALSRIATSFPCLTVVPLILSRLETTKFFRGNNTRIMGANLGLITLAFLTALPAAIALFPQEGSISVDRLEAKFQGLQNKNGTAVTRFTFNKGL